MSSQYSISIALLKFTTVFIGYWNGTLARDGLRKTYNVSSNSRIKTNITWPNYMHCQHQAIWIMFGQATRKKSGTWSSSNSHCLSDDWTLLYWILYLGLSNTRNDLLNAASIYASTFHFPWQQFCYILWGIYALKLHFVKLSYKEKICLFSRLFYKEKLQKWSKNNQYC